MRLSINLLFWLLLTAFVLEFSLDVSISSIPGFSLKNIVLYGLIMASFFVNFSLDKPLVGRNNVNIPIVLFFLYCLVSLVATAMFKVVPGYSMMQELIFFKNYMDAYILFIITYSVLHDEKSIKNLLVALVVVMAVFIAITVLSSFDILAVRRASVDERWGRTRGAFAEANQFAAYLVMFVPLLGAFILTTSSRFVKSFLVGTLLVALYVLLLSGSRGGLVGLVVAVGVYYLLYSRHALPKSLMNLAMVYAAALFVMVLIFLTLPETTANGLMLKLSGKFVDVTETDYSSGRLETWMLAFQLFLNSPLVGTGWRTFVPLIGWNSHSDYILYLVTTGVIGFYLFILIYVRIIKSALQLRKLVPRQRHFFNAFISGVAAFMVAMLFVNIYNPLFFVLMYAAAILKLGALPGHESGAAIAGSGAVAATTDNLLGRRRSNRRPQK